MIKHSIFVMLLISTGIIWLISGWQVAEAVSRAQSTPEAAPTATPVGPQPEGSSNTTTSDSETTGILDLTSIEPLTLIAAILLTLAIVGFVLAVIFMAAHKYSEWLNREMPQPIYTQERRLLTVIEDSVKAIIEQTMGHDRVTGQERDVRVGIVEFERTANAGVNLKLHVDTEERPDAEGEAFRQLLTYVIAADRWGRISKMELEGVPRFITIERVTLVDTDGGGDDQGTDMQAVPTNGHLVASGGNGVTDSFMSQNDTMISVISRRRYWNQ